MDYREDLIELVDEGLLDARAAVIMLVKYMSNDDVGDCLDCNELSKRFLNEGDIKWEK